LRVSIYACTPLLQIETNRALRPEKMKKPAHLEETAGWGFIEYAIAFQW
jgi:hypothetical protein